MLAAAEARTAALPLRDRVFYWLDEDEDLSKHRGQRVEIKGELEDFEKGKVEVDRKDDYTKVKLHLDGKTEEAKVPSSWLNEWANPKDQKFEIVARRIDVKKDAHSGLASGRVAGHGQRPYGTSAWSSPTSSNSVRSIGS